MKILKTQVKLWQDGKGMIYNQDLDWEKVSDDFEIEDIEKMTEEDFGLEDGQDMEVIVTLFEEIPLIPTAKAIYWATEEDVEFVRFNRFILFRSILHGDEFWDEYQTEEEAIKAGDKAWDRMSDYDKKRTFEMCVIKSANPDPDAVDHMDGTIIKRWK